MVLAILQLVPHPKAQEVSVTLFEQSQIKLCLRYPDTVYLNAVNFKIEEQENSNSSIWEKVVKIQHRYTVLL